MTPARATPDAARAIGQERLDARRRRTQSIRTRIAAGSVATFLALFSGLWVQMASGHDPGLRRATTTTPPALTTTVPDQPSAPAPPSTYPSEPYGADDGSSADDGYSASPAPMTTRQS